MGRRRDDDDDDEDDDFEEPRKRRSKKGAKKSNTTTILIVVGVAVVVLVLACGGIAFWVVSSTKKVMEEVVAQSVSAEEAENFLGKLSSEQTQAAYDSTTPAFKTSIGKDQFALLLKKHPLLTKHDDATPLTYNQPTGIAPNRKKVTSYELTEWDDDGDPNFDRPRPKKGASTGPKSLTVTITVAEQAGGIWKVDNLVIGK